LSAPAGHRRAPRPLALAVQDLQSALAPATALARIQACWPEAAGEAVAAAARPTGERAGVVTVSCDAAVWAAELQLMGPELAARINAQLGEDLVREVRCRTAV
jgi:predicted nucleic acid-binding Zn ribbon protein